MSSSAVDLSNIVICQDYVPGERSSKASDELAVKDLLSSSHFVVLESAEGLTTLKSLESALKLEKKCNDVFEKVVHENNVKIRHLEDSLSQVDLLRDHIATLESENRDLKSQVEKLQSEVESFRSKELTYWKEKFQNAKNLNDKASRERFQEFYRGVRTHDPNLHFFAYSSETTSKGLL